MYAVHTAYTACTTCTVLRRQHYLKNAEQNGDFSEIIFSCPANFEYYLNGERYVSGTWYKHAFREAEFSRDLSDDEIDQIRKTCIASLQPAE